GRRLARRGRPRDPRRRGEGAVHPPRPVRAHVAEARHHALPVRGPLGVWHSRARVRRANPWVLRHTRPAAISYVGLWVVGKGFASLHSAVSLLAGLASLSRAMYSAVQFVKPAPRTGEILAIVRAAKGDKPPAGTTVEILTPQDTL